jgi:uncharacterized protein (TIGR03435 family)
MRTVRTGFKCFVMSVAICGLFAALSNSAQQNVPVPNESFDTLSIRQVFYRREPEGGTTPPKNIPCEYQPDRVRCQRSLRYLIEDAYQVDDIEVYLPKWTNDQDHWFAIEGTMPPGTTKETARLMLRQGLAERFGLKIHWEKRDTPVYALVPGKHGATLEPVVDPDHPKLRTFTNPTTGKSTPAVITQTEGEFFAAAITMDLFAKNLRVRAGLDRPVVDMTGLTGVYTFDLKWLPAEPPSYVDPAILSVMETKLGLRLEKRVLPLNVLVVDHVEEMPTGN